ncbi:MAG: SGNH/GDSL hydrolase family protein [Acidovorax sp.]|nr:SGNH/GDSL hydrolase family protein [Acidovorax sp.]
MAKKIVVLGDSLSAQQNLLAPAWPDLLQATLCASGEDVKVVNLSTNGYRFDLVMNTATYGAATPAQKCVAEAPDLVILALGYNDANTYPLAQAQGHVTTLLGYLKANLPSAKIIYASETPYDKVHGTPGTLLNRHSLPAFFQLNAPGVLSGLYCSEMLGNSAQPNYQTVMGVWQSLDAFIKAQPQIDGHYEFPLWPCARLGLLGTDGLHLTDLGHKFMAGAARHAMGSLPAAKALFPQLGTQGDTKWNKWEMFFNAVLVDNGTEYVSSQNLEVGDVHFMHYYGPWNALLADTWYLRTHATHNASTPNYIRDGSQVWSVTGATPLAAVYTSFNNGPWNLQPRKTDVRGNFLDAGSFDDFPDGTYTLRYRVGDEVFPAVTLTVSGPARAKADGSNATGVWPIQIAGPSAMQRQGLFTKRSMQNGLPFPSAVRMPLDMPDTTAYGLLAAGSILEDGKEYKGCRLSTAAPGDCWVRVNARGSVVANSGGKLVWLGLFVGDTGGNMTKNMVLGGSYSSPRPSELVSFSGEAVIKLSPGQYIAPWVYVVDGGASISDNVAGNFWEFTANVIY